MLHGDALVFCEVRFRASMRYGGAGASITHKKQQRLLLTAQHYLSHNQQYSNQSSRCDVVAVTLNADGSPEFDWIQGAFIA